MTSGPPDSDGELLEALTRRAEVLERLRESPAHKPELVAELDLSRSTLDRAVRELEAMGLVERGDEGVAATVAGRLAVERLSTFGDDVADFAAARPVLEPLPADAPVEPAAVAGGEATLAADPTPYRALERFHDALAAGTRYRAVLPALDDPRHVRVLYDHVVTGGHPAELVVAPEVLRSLREEFPRQAAALAEHDEFRLLVAEDPPPFALGLVGGDPDPTVALVVFADSGAVHGTVVNESPEAARWAERLYEATAADATERTDALAGDPDGGDVAAGARAGAPLGRSLPVSLERAGFVRFDASFVRDEPVADPATAWRAGLSLPEVHRGYAVERRVTDGIERAADAGGSAGQDGDHADAPTEPDEDDAGRLAETAGDDGLATALRAVLSSGTDCVVVGPPGSGKSTLCKQVACDWYDEGIGPVLYRERGRGRPFEAVADLVATVDGADGHALVVVEDAPRPEANAVFEALDRLADRDDVSVLLDARETEWADPPDGERPDADLHVVTMPPVDERAVERVVEHVEHTTDASVEAPPAELLSTVGEAAADERAPGEMLLLHHRLASYVDPLADGRTSLDTAVEELYDDLAGDDLALAVCVLANALNAAGLAVTPGALHAVADGDHEAVDAALDRLTGRVLFEDRGGAGRYRTVHEAWSAAFLDHLLAAAGEHEAAERFGDGVDALLALADEPGRRARIRTHLDGHGDAAARTDRTHLDALAADPAGWVGETAEAIHALGRERPKLAPLFGDGADDAVRLPDAAPAAVAGRRPAWLGRLFLAGDYYDRAQRAFRRLPAEGSDADGEPDGGSGGGSESEHESGAEPDTDPDSGTGPGPDSEPGGDLGADLAFERELGLAKVAAGRSEYETAAERARASLVLLGDADRPVDRARGEHQLGEIRQLQDEYEAASEHLQTALAGFEAAGDRRRAAEVLQLLGANARYRGDTETAADRLQRSLAASRAVGDRRREAETLRQYGALAASRGDYDRARERYARSLELCRTLGDRYGQAAALNNMGNAARNRGAHDRAREHFQRALEVAREIGNAMVEATVLGNLGMVAERRGEYDEAREHLERSLEITAEISDTRTVAVRRNNLGLVAVRQADHDLARESFERGRELAVAHDLPRREVNAENGLGHVARMCGRYDAAREHHERALELAREIDARRREADGLNKLGVVALRLGEHDRARERFETALELARELDVPREVVRGLVGLGVVARERGAYDAAEEHLTAAVERGETAGDRHPTAVARLAAAELALDRGDLAAAAERVGQAREAFAEMGAPQWEARARRLLGRVAAAEGDPATAREPLAAAVETFEAVGAAGDVLETLAHLVEACRTDGDEAAATEWHRRARDAAATAPAAAVDAHGEWVAGGEARPGVDADTGGRAGERDRDGDGDEDGEGGA